MKIKIKKFCCKNFHFYDPTCISELKSEEEKTVIRNRLDKISHLLIPEPAVNKELEDFKLKHDEEINELKNKHMEDEAKYEKEKEDLINQ